MATVRLTREECQVILLWGSEYQKGCAAVRLPPSEPFEERLLAKIRKAYDESYSKSWKGKLQRSKDGDE